MVLLDRPKEALPLLHKGLDLYRATGSEMAVPYHLSVLAEAYAKSDRFEDAHRTIGEALAVVEKNDDRFQEAELHRLLGEFHLAEKDDQARRALLPYHDRDRTPPARQGVGVARHDEPRPGSGSGRAATTRHTAPSRPSTLHTRKASRPRISWMPKCCWRA